jgi:hypothetical protein
MCLWYSCYSYDELDSFYSMPRSIQETPQICSSEMSILFYFLSDNNEWTSVV